MFDFYLTPGFPLVHIKHTYTRTLDDSTFDTVFQSVTGDTLILRVHWPPTASGMIVRPPAMTLAGVEARHPWIDSRMRITGYDPIQTSDAWIDANIHLGVAVHTVIQHLQLNPPTVVRFVDSGLSAIQTKKPPQPPSSQQSSTGNGPPPPAYHDSMVTKKLVSGASSRPAHSTVANAALQNIDWPAIPPQFKELDTLSRERLEELIQNELEFRTFTNQLDTIQQYSEIQRRQLDKNVSTAKSNLQYESEIQQLHSSITKLHAELQEKVAAFQELEQQQDKILQPPPVSKIVRELTKAKKEAYVQSEQIAEQWLQQQQQQSSSSLSSSFNEENGTGNSIPTFIEAFKAVRKLQHVRAAKLELIQQGQTNGTSTFYSL